MKDTFRSLNALRFIFIICIFLFHFTDVKGGVSYFPEGYCGVTFFFILSGFLLAYSKGDKVRLGKLKTTKFVFDRLRKIYPLYFITVVYFIVKSTIAHYPCWKMAAVHLLLLQSWIPDESVYYCWNYPTWFLSSLMLCYVLFVPIIRFANRNKTVTSCIFVALLIVYFSFIHFVPDSQQEYFYYIFPPFRLIDFCIGILLSEFYKRNKMLLSKSSFIQNSFLEFFSILLLIGVIMLASDVPLILRRESLYWLPMSVLIIVMAFTEGNSILSTLFNNKMMQMLGASTMVFFLFHGIYIDVIRQLVGHLEPSYIVPMAVFLSVVSIGIHISADTCRKMLQR